MTIPNALDTRNEFVARHIGPREEDVRQMLVTVGHESMDALIAAVIPPASSNPCSAPLPATMLSRYSPMLDRGRVDTVYGDRNLTCSCPPYPSTRMRDWHAWFSVWRASRRIRYRGNTHVS